MKDIKEKTEGFLKDFRSYNSEPDGFKNLVATKILREMILETEDDQEKIEKIKDLFWLAYHAHEDKTALYLLKLIEKAYDFKETNIAEGPGGDRHLTNAARRADRQFRDLLMAIYWLLPDKKVDKGEHERHRGHKKAIMLQTKFYILEQITKEWRPSRENAERAFRFLIAAYKPLGEGWRSNGEEFQEKSEGRWVSPEEQKQIISLIKEQDARFNPEELEKWMKQPSLPSEFERILAIARTRNGGWNLWRADIRNAELVRPFVPEERSEAAIELFKRDAETKASVDRSVQKLIESMTEGHSWSGREEIGKSEYVLGKIEFKYNHLFEVIISIQVDSEYPEALFQDNFGRARRHINSWIKEHHPFKIHLIMTGGQTNAEETDTLQGESYRQPQ